MRRVAPLLLIASLTACTTTSTQPDDPNAIKPAAEAARGEVGGLCGPPSEADIAACEDPRYSALGTSKEQPNEWGTGAGFATNFAWGRLQCADGGTPDTRRLGSVGKAAAEPTSPAASERPLDVVDRWQVTCHGTGERIAVYHNLYRCGPRCPPAGLAWEHEQENSAGQEARALVAADKLEDAVALLRARLKTYPRSERVVLAVVSTLDEEREVMARELLEEACNANNMHACRAIGMLSLDSPAGATAFARACQLGHKGACDDATFSQFLAGTLPPEQLEPAFNQLDTACAERYPRACVYLAVIMKRSGLAQDKITPILQRGCEQDDRLACSLLDDIAEEASPDGKLR